MNHPSADLSRLRGLLRVVAQREPGPSPSFAQHHLLLAVLTVGEAGAIGRKALAARTGLGEGAIRTVLSRLRGEGYLTVSPSGCALTKKGEALFSELRQSLPKMAAMTRTSLTVGEKQFVTLVRAAAKNVTNGIEQRDAAIKAGADGATTFIIRRQKFSVLGGSDDCERDYPGEAWEGLRRLLSPNEGDAVIVCGSGNPMLSKVGALSAALSLLRSSL